MGICEVSIEEERQSRRSQVGRSTVLWEGTRHLSCQQDWDIVGTGHCYIDRLRITCTVLIGDLHSETVDRGFSLREVLNVGLTIGERIVPCASLPDRQCAVCTSERGVSDCWCIGQNL